ncbi:hypothetical protein SLEP1_g4362 [Rubroshorea leprosula]|uniref:Uncharacterized protein n=1 Tax=Rubroshorea leprosula TaxID=152421 RepID=A0AAV5HW47_9ROSI|nr:hypothetical protein SLEP1_g4362 [Rubroshorea leprosula]
MEASKEDDEKPDCNYCQTEENDPATSPLEHSFEQDDLSMHEVEEVRQRVC